MEKRSHGFKLEKPRMRITEETFIVTEEEYCKNQYPDDWQKHLKKLAAFSYQKVEVEDIMPQQRIM